MKYQNGKSKNRNPQLKPVKKTKKSTKKQKERKKKITADEGHRVSIFEFIEPLYKDLFGKGKKGQKHLDAWDALYAHCHRYSFYSLVAI